MSTGPFEQARQRSVELQGANPSDIEPAGFALRGDRHLAGRRRLTRSARRSIGHTLRVWLILGVVWWCSPRCSAWRVPDLDRAVARAARRAAALAARRAGREQSAQPERPVKRDVAALAWPERLVKRDEVAARERSRPRGAEEEVRPAPAARRHDRRCGWQGRRERCGRQRRWCGRHDRWRHGRWRDRRWRRPWRGQRWRGRWRGRRWRGPAGPRRDRRLYPSRRLYGRSDLPEREGGDARFLEMHRRSVCADAAFAFVCLHRHSICTSGCLISPNEGVVSWARTDCKRSLSGQSVSRTAEQRIPSRRAAVADVDNAIPGEAPEGPVWR